LPPGLQRVGLMMRFVAALVLLGMSLSVGSVAHAAGYRLKSGDILEVTVWQDEKLNRKVVIAPDGGISFPLAGHLVAGGRTVEAVEQQLTERLQKLYKDKIDVTVAVAAIKEIPLPPPEPKVPPPPPIDPSFFVTGEVKNPGKFFFKTTTNVLQGISIAGGLGIFAAPERIQIRRKVNGHEELMEFDYKAFTSGEDVSGNVKLHNGDVIIVPEKGLFE
jgi:polysaccharide biosynthesis/export protein